MKSAALMLMALFPFSLTAQVRNTTDVAHQNAPSAIWYADGGFLNDYSASTPPEVVADTESAPENYPQGKGAAQPGPSAQQTSEQQPIIPLKMVGYVDSAVIDSEVRIRAEEGFHDTVPDRAEFFYPQCVCTGVTGAPGHDFKGASDNIDFGQIYLYAEYAPVTRMSFFVEVPFRWIEPHSFINGSFQPPGEVAATNTLAGLSDVRAGIRVAIAQTATHSLTVQLKAYFPSGSAADDLGTGHYSFEPSLLYYQRLSRRWVIESQIGDWHPIGGSTGYLPNSTSPSNFAGDVLLYGIGPSYLLISGERFSLAPVVEMFGWHVFGGLETLDTSFDISPNVANPACTSLAAVCAYNAAGVNIVNLKVGARMNFGAHNSIYLGFGQALTDSSWYRQLARFEYRYSF